MESLFWNIRFGFSCRGNFCCGMFVVESSLCRLCCGIFVVETLLWDIPCERLVWGNFVVESFVVESFVVESLLWNICC